MAHYRMFTFLAHHWSLTIAQDVATRILAAWYLLGQDSGFPATNFNAWNSNAGQHVNVQGNHKEYVFHSSTTE